LYNALTLRAWLLCHDRAMLSLEAICSERMPNMDRYLVESPHTAEDCTKAKEEIQLAGYLHHFEWGCEDGVHSAWAIIEAENREHARQIVPWMMRDKARIIKLVKFEVADPVHHKQT
jgi:hypothetical protein